MSQVSTPAARGALVILACTQLLIVLDATAITVALPSVQHSLGISDADRLWVTNAATLGWGGMLLVGGKIADHIGRRRTLLLGLSGFGFASLVAGVAPTAAVVIGARAMQGVAAGLVTPSALAILSKRFVQEKERSRAFAAYGSAGALGSVAGLVVGGVLSQVACWRWCFFVDFVLTALISAAAALRLSEVHVRGSTGVDAAGLVTGTLGVVAIATSLTQVSRAAEGSSSVSGIAFLALGLALLLLFWGVENRALHPLLPPSVLRHRQRAGSMLAMFLICLGVLPILMLTLFLQNVLHYGALEAGLALVPVSLGMVAGSALAGELAARMGAGRVTLVGLTAVALGLAVLTQLTARSVYLQDILPAQMLLSVGLGLAFVPLSSTALLGVADGHTGAGSAVLLATQQMGGALGASLLNTVATIATASWMVRNGPAGQPPTVNAVAFGYSSAFRVGFILVLAAGTVVAITASTFPRPSGRGWTSVWSRRRRMRATSPEARGQHDAQRGDY